MRILILLLISVSTFAQLPETGSLSLKSAAGVGRSISQEVDGNETGNKSLSTLCATAVVSPCTILAFRGWFPGAPPHFQTFALSIETTNTSSAANTDLVLELTDLDGEMLNLDVSPPYTITDWDDNGIEAYYHTIQLDVTNNSAFDVNVHILVAAVTQDTHTVNINFVVNASSSDFRTFTFPYSAAEPTSRTLTLTCSEGG